MGNGWRNCTHASDSTHWLPFWNMKFCCSWRCAWIQFAWSTTTIGHRFQLVQSGPAWRMFQLPLPFFLPSTVFFHLWVPPFHFFFCLVYYLFSLFFFSIVWHFSVPFYVTKPLVKPECHFIGAGEELLLVLYYATVRRAWFSRFLCPLCLLRCCSFLML